MASLKRRIERLEQRRAATAPMRRPPVTLKELHADPAIPRAARSILFGGEQLEKLRPRIPAVLAAIERSPIVGHLQPLAASLQAVAANGGDR